MNRTPRRLRRKKICQGLIQTIQKSRCLDRRQYHNQPPSKRFQTSRIGLKRALRDSPLLINPYILPLRSLPENRPKLPMSHTLEMDFHIQRFKMTTYRHWNSHQTRGMGLLVEDIFQKYQPLHRNRGTLLCPLRHQMMSSI